MFCSSDFQPGGEVLLVVQSLLTKYPSLVDMKRRILPKRPSYHKVNVRANTSPVYYQLLCALLPINRMKTIVALPVQYLENSFKKYVNKKLADAEYYYINLFSYFKKGG